MDEKELFQVTNIESYVELKDEQGKSVQVKNLFNVNNWYVKIDADGVHLMGG